jgi:tripartite-type tricarboxylate transporter receptor subunit TctC
MRILKPAALAACLAASCPAPAAAQWNPVRPVRLIVPYSTGTGTDTLARTLALKFAEVFGQQVVVENQPGANGIVGTEALAKAPKDGHTLGMIAANHVVTPALYSKLPYDTLRDFTPVTIAGAVGFLFVAHPSLPAKSVKELIALARARPGQLLYASAGNGSPPHLSGELLKTMAGIDIVHVPYKGLAPGLTDLLGGQVSLMFPAISAGLPHVRAGRLQAYAVTSLKRSPAAPEVPTMDESGLKGYEVYSWIGVMGPAGLPQEVVGRLHAETARILQLSDVQQRLSALGMDLIGSTPEQFARIMQTDLDKFGRLVKAAGAKLD